MEPKTIISIALAVFILGGLVLLAPGRNDHFGLN